MFRPSLLLMVVLVTAVMVRAEQPVSETLLPATTKGFISVPSTATLKKNWGETDLGKMVALKEMEGFWSDLETQLQDKLTQNNARLGLSWKDLEGVASGEIAMAMMQPNNDRTKSALVVMADVAGNLEQARATLKKVHTQLVTERNAAFKNIQIQGVPVSSYVIPPGKGETLPTRAYNCIHRDWLLASDDIAQLRTVLGRLEGQVIPRLGDLEHFKLAMERVTVLENAKPDLRFFFDPIGYGEVLQASQRKKRDGRDVPDILKKEGFDAVRGVGGAVNFDVGGRESVYRVGFVTDTDGERPRLQNAARVLSFPVAKNLDPPVFVPANVSNCSRISIEMVNAFDKIGTLIDRWEGQPIWDDMIKGLLTDPKGPQVDVRKDLVVKLQPRVYLITRSEMPVTPESEKQMYAFELANPEVVDVVDRVLRRDRTATALDKFEGIPSTVWRIQGKVRRDEKKQRRFGGGAAGRPGRPGRPAAPQGGGGGEGELDGAVTVTPNFLFFATDVEFLVSVLQDQGARLSTANDFLAIEQELAGLGAGVDSIRYFTRLHKSQHVNYELLRTNQMPKSKTLLGKLLNEVFKPEEEGVEREQQIDGAKMPPFETVEKYLGQGGFYLAPKPDGWTLTGCITKRGAEAPPLTGAAAPAAQ